MRRQPYIHDLASAGVLLAVAIWWLLSACGVVDDTEHAIKGVGADFAEVSYCEFADCGQVFQCTLPTPYGGDGGPLKPELCWETDDSGPLATSLAQRYGYPVLCLPTSRGGSFGWPCIYQCPSARGCNAYSGCYCEDN